MRALSNSSSFAVKHHQLGTNMPMLTQCVFVIAKYAFVNVKMYIWGIYLPGDKEDTQLCFCSTLNRSCFPSPCYLTQTQTRKQLVAVGVTGYKYFIGLGIINCSGRLSLILALLQCQDSIRTTIQMLMIFLFQVQVQVQVHVQMTNIQQSSPDYSESTRQNLAPTSHHQDWNLKIFFCKISYFQSCS